MDLRYCDVCGSLVTGASEIPEDEGVICETCLRTRRVAPERGEAAPDEKRPTRFRCPHCEVKLRAKAVRDRRETACPRCQSRLVLYPDGRVE